MITEGNIPVRLLIVELHIPSSQSLKAKRKVIRSLKDRLVNTFNVSVAEAGFLDKWQRSLLALAVTGKDGGHLEQQCQKMLGFIEREIIGEAQITGWEIEDR